MDRLRNRLVLWIWGSSVGLLILIMGVAFVEGRRHFMERLQNEATHLAGYYARLLDSQLSAASTAAIVLARTLERDPNTRQRELVTLTTGVVESHPELVSITVAFVSNQVGRIPFTALWSDGEARVVAPILGPWWDYVLRTRQPAWSVSSREEPPVGILALRYGFPFYDVRTDKLAGAVAASTSMEQVRDTLRELSGEGAAYGFLVTRNGMVLSHDPERFHLDPELLARLSDRTLPVHECFAPVRDPVSGQPAWVAWNEAGDTGVLVGVVYLQKSAWLHLSQLTREAAVMAVLGSVVLLILVTAIARSVVDPITKLADTTRELARGDLDVDVPDMPKASREVRDLAESFRAMTLELQLRLVELEQSTIEKERIASQMRIGSDIQASLLPQKFPPSERYRMHAMTRPAQEVGGDFYDLLQLEEGALGAAIGDISGKGVPAAIYMGMASTVLKVAARSGRTPGDVLQVVNRELCDDGSGLYATAFYAVMYPDGRVAYANGGHHLPLLIRNGACTPLPTVETMPLGILNSVELQEGEYQLLPGDWLVFYTDGVTEAMNEEREQYSEERLSRRLVELLADATHQPDSLVQALVADLDAFEGGVTPSDDLTLVVVRFCDSTGCEPPERPDSGPVS